MIVRARIHPGIGVARIGDSTDEFIIGPEVIGAPSQTMRDAAGALKRQAARFRVYGIDEAGNVVDELTSETAQISWTVHVANRKAAWYRFLAALDVPEATDTKCALRNPGVKGPDRESLIIDPGPKVDRRIVTSRQASVQARRRNVQGRAGVAGRIAHRRGRTTTGAQRQR